MINAGEMREIGFDPADCGSALARLPCSPAIFALRFDPTPPETAALAAQRTEPYIGRTPNLRARLERLLQPSEKHPRRLQLAGRVRRVAWRVTGSDFESLLLQFSLLEKIYGAKALERMHLRMPAFVRFLGSNRYPRVVVTHRPSLREADWAYGPFPSRAAAERFIDEMLKLFLLRRCMDDLNPDPNFPGCVYSEMKMCLAPCFKGCTDARYAEESAAVEQFMATRGESRLAALCAGRDAASADLDFENAAALHAQIQKLEAVRALLPELARPLRQLRAVILQRAAELGEVAIFLFENGCLRGPAGFSTLGMRIQNEMSGSTSLFAQPMALEPIAERKSGGAERANHEPKEQRQGTTDAGAGAESAPVKIARGVLEARLEEALAGLASNSETPTATERQGHLALVKRWYYRPEARREGEIFFPDSAGCWPVKSILRGIGRIMANRLAANTRAKQVSEPDSGPIPNEAGAARTRTSG